MKKLKDYLLKHKIISLILLLVIIFAGYKLYTYITSNSGETHYLISAVEKGTILQSVSGTGQVSAGNQVELKPKSSGEVVYLGAKTGDYVGAGQLILQLDSRTAEIDLKNAKLSLQKMTEGVTTGLGGNSGLAKDYEDALSNMNSLFSDLPEIMTGFDSLLNNYQVSSYKMNLPDTTSRNYYARAQKNYYSTKVIYDKTLAKYQGLTRPLSNENIISLTNDSYLMLQALNQLAKDINVYLAYTYDQTKDTRQNNEMTTDKNNVSTWLKTINSDLSLVGANRDTLKNSTLNIETQKLAVKQKEYAYQDSFLYAPFGGLVQINIKQNDSVSGGASIGTIVSAKKIATISLNEVDIAKVRVGQKATLTFDAIDGLSISGQVAEADVVGAVSQGVVSYNVKISFDTQDERIRSGMSVSADIVTDIKQDVVAVPSGAVKTDGTTNYVEIVDKSTSATTGTQGVTLSILPTKQEVTVGLTDDTSTEILSGLSVGDKVIAKTIAGTSATKTTTSSSLFGGAKTSGSSARSGASGIPMH